VGKIGGRNMIKILIVEDQAMLRDSLVHVIGSQTDMEAAGATGDASKCLELCRNLKPDLVLMDVVLENDANGIALAAKIRQELPDIKIVVMTSLPEITFMEEARKAGAHSYIYKNVGNDHLFFIIRSTMQGSGCYPGPADKWAYSLQFTEKEIAVIRLICQGLEREYIIKELGITENMLKSTIKTILDKTGFDSISKFAIYAVSRNLIVPEFAPPS